jgi:hypothetical protein
VLDVELEDSSASVAPSMHLDSPSQKGSSRRSKSGSCPCCWGPCRMCSLSLGSPRPQAIHRDMPPALLHEHQPSEVQARGQPSPKGPHSLLAFGSYLRLFLSGHPPGRRAMERLIVASETSSSKSSQCSLRVKSGFLFRCSSSHSLKGARPSARAYRGSSSSRGPRLGPPVEPALDGGAGDPEEFLDLLARDAPVNCGERLQSEVPRISAHGGHSRVGSLLMQTAVSCDKVGLRGIFPTGEEFQHRLSDLWT